MIQPYPDGLAEIADQLAHLQLLLRLGVTAFRRRRPQQPGMASSVIFDDEIDHFLRRQEQAFSGRADSAPGHEPLRQWLRGSFDRFMEHYAATPDTVRLPLRDLATRFDLSPPEVELFMLCLAPEVDSGYGRVYAYLQDDVSALRPTMNLALELSAPDWQERLLLRRHLNPGLPLFRHQLVHGTNGNLGLDDPLHVDPTVLAHVLGDLVGSTRPSSSSLPLSHLLVAEPACSMMLHLSEALRRRPEGPWLLCLHGSPSSGKRTAAEALAAHVQRGLAVHTPNSAEPDDGGPRLSRWLRDARLFQDLPCLDIGELPEEKADRLMAHTVALAERERFAIFFVLCPTETRAPTGKSTLSSLDIDLPLPPAPLRRRAWERFMASEGLTCGLPDLDSLARSFPLAIGQIHRVCREGAARVAIEGGMERALPVIRSACRAQVRHKLDRLAQHVPPVHDWNDIVLPADQQRQLEEVSEAIRLRDQVLEGWHFGRKVSVSPGTSILFFGPSGTGKTMAAAILASHIGMDLHRVDLSRVVSKYIGETEKNLESLFTQARSACTVLFFDEADALFGKRSEVRDAHDRYANIEVAYLLQRMESYEGVTILATNLRKNIDAAFLRRIQFSVEFPQPTVELRLRIWQRVWPEGAPLADDVDLVFMANQFELSGGGIRNVALKAAYLAAQDQQPIGMPHLILATRREFQKLGRLCVDDAFGSYRHLLRVQEAS